MEHDDETMGHRYQQRARSLAEAVEKQESASRDANHWQEVLSTTENRNERRYVEGLVRIATLKALHHNLVAQSCQRDGRAGDVEARLERARPAAVKTSASEIPVSGKAEALPLLADCYREFGNQQAARKYEEGAVAETASAQRQETADDKQPRQIESPAAGRREHGSNSAESRHSPRS